MLRPLFALLLLLALPLASAQAPPVAQFSAAPSTPVVGQAVHFEDHSTGNITAWDWSFGDGATATGRNVTHAYAGAGTYRVNLTVTDDEGRTASREGAIVVAQEAATEAPLLPTFLYWLMPLLSGAAILALAFVVLVRGQPVIYNKVFFLLYAANALKALTEGTLFFLRYEVGATNGILFALLDANFAIGFLYPHFFLWFVLVFPRPLRPALKTGGRGSLVLLLSVPFFLLHFVFGAPIAVTHGFFNVYTTILALVALGLLVYHAWETDSAEERTRIRLLAYTFSLIVLSTIAVTALQVVGEAALATAAGLVFASFLEVVGCVILFYAILRYQLMGVEVFVKKATRATFFAVVIGAVFVVVSNSVEQLFQVKYLAGVQLDFIIAGFISTGLMYPVQKLTGRIANRLFPQAGSEAPDYVAQRRMEIYEAQLRYALLDGVLKQKELAMLHALRDSLGVRPEELRQVAQRVPGATLSALLAARAAPPATGTQA